MARPIRGLTAAARAAGMPRGGYVPTAAIRWRLGNVHVATSNLTVAREFWQRAKKAKLSIPLRRAIVRVALREHRSNLRLYLYVMGGH